MSWTVITAQFFAGVLTPNRSSNGLQPAPLDSALDPKVEVTTNVQIQLRFTVGLSSSLFRRRLIQSELSPGALEGARARLRGHPGVGDDWRAGRFLRSEGDERGRTLRAAVNEVESRYTTQTFLLPGNLKRSDLHRTRLLCFLSKTVPRVSRWCFCSFSEPHPPHGFIRKRSSPSWSITPPLG